MLNAKGNDPASIAQGNVISGIGTLIKVYWFNPAAVGDTFTLVDATKGVLILTGRCEAANQSQLFDQSNGLSATTFNGLGCSQLSSGTLYVTIA